MKNIIRIEELAMLVLSAYGLYYYNVAWWWYLLLLVGPDVSMIAYLAGNKSGAISYNIFHHKSVGVALTLAGFLLQADVLLYTGIVIFGHSSFDRMMGYGLKYFEGFHFTHLGKIGKEQ